MLSYKILQTVNKDGITYDLTESQSRELNCVVYGMKISTDCFGDNEQAEIHDITSDLTFAQRILHDFTEGFVTPSVFGETLEDYLATNL